MTTNSISHNRTLFLEDNLPVLRGLDSDSIDLIATDPPFNKGVPAFKGKTKAGQNVKFKDVWNWIDDVHVDWLNEMSKRHPTLSNVILYANAAAGDDMGAFLCWMAVRVLEMHRVLKDTGSMYLHCDPTASHYLKAMMDAVFGRKQFRNEIVWRKYAGRKNNAKRKFTTQHDLVFFYGKSPDARFNGVMVPHSEEEIKKKYKYVDENGRRYRLSWGRSYQLKGSQKRIYLDESPGRAVGSLWIEDGLQLNTSSRERTGYPTQKPLALYARMIEASSNPGDMVLDPFAGCATTCVAAEQLGRQWIGIDIEEESGGGDPRTSGARGLREYGMGCHRSDADGSPCADGRRGACGPRAVLGAVQAQGEADIGAGGAGGVGEARWTAVPRMRIRAPVLGLHARRPQEAEEVEGKGIDVELCATL